MTPQLPDLWAEEIRDFLLGRLAAGPQPVSLPAPVTHEFKTVPIAHWWIFEGKFYDLLAGTLAARFAEILLMARRLDSTFNPRLRLSDRPDGEVDWGQTLARGAYRPGSDFVVRSSGTGLDEAERAALRGWVRWLESEWLEYARTIRVDTVLDSGGFGDDFAGPFTLERLRRWAHVARRSRWPLLREVVAESLRPLLEPDEMDRIPLPSDPAKLFELLCLVRIARHFVPRPKELRWLDLHSRNALRIDELSCRYQQSLGTSDVLGAPDYCGALAEAILTFDVGIPKYVDIAFDFEEPVNGFHGLIVEAKSGTQQYRDAVAQLRTYRGARPRRVGSRYLVWGIVQGPVAPDASPERVAKVASSGAADDVWIFSSANGIGTVLNTLFPRGIRQIQQRPGSSAVGVVGH